MRLTFRDQTPPSRLEKNFLLHWQSLTGPPLDREFRFHATCRWRADFAHIESRTLIEIDGGIWVRGRHTRPQGFAKDTEKYLEAFLVGWWVVRLTDAPITAPMVERIFQRLAP